MRQHEALDILKLGRNAFLTGAAGAGKSYLLNQYISYLREHSVEVAVTASTGIAATHINGQTIHSWSGMGIRTELTDNDRELLVRDGRIKHRLSATKVLIIDEVSMLHAYQLDMLNQITKMLLNSTLPFAGMQLIMCGDFFQLPPVVANERERVFAYESNAWQEAAMTVCYLEEQHRQGSDPLLTVLNSIRSGTAGEHTKVPLRTRYRKDPLTSDGRTVPPTKLYSRNINVDVINTEALEKLPGEIHTFRMSSTGFPKIVEGLKKNCLAPEVLLLKVGAEVMFVKNSKTGAYVNGTRGIVTEFDKTTGWPVVKTFSAESISTTPEDWNSEDGNGIIRATITQIPLRLAWAITIHKSQGMTLDTAEVDLSDAFEHGMGYVALSRVRTLNGLKLLGLNEIALQVHPKILQQDKIFLELSNSSRTELAAHTEDEMRTLQQNTLFTRFSGSISSEKAATKLPKIKDPKPSSKNPSSDLTRQSVLKKVPLEKIASGRGIKLGTVLDHLETLKGLKQLPDITYLLDTIPEQDVEEILTAFRSSPDGKLAPISAQFSGRHSYNTLRIMRLFMYT